jgi:hypothetical protein
MFLNIIKNLLKYSLIRFVIFLYLFKKHSRAKKEIKNLFFIVNYFNYFINFKKMLPHKKKSCVPTSRLLTCKYSRIFCFLIYVRGKQQY